MAPTKSTLNEHHVQEELALYSSLCLLEAPTGEGAKLVELSKTMFRKQNLKSFEYIIYHCYTVVKGKAAAKKHFRWPYDGKDLKQKKEFYTSVTTWLKESGTLETHGSSLETFKRNPQGPKLVSFLLDLVTYTIDTHHQQMFPDDVAPQSDIADAQLLSLLSEPLITAAKAQSQLQTERLLTACQAGAGLQQQAEELAGCMGDLYYSLKAQLGQAQTQVNTSSAAGPCVQQQDDCSVVDLQASSTSTSYQGQQRPMLLPEELMQQYSELKGLWTQLMQHMQQYAGLSQLVDGLTGSGVHPHAIDAMKLRQCGQLPLASTPGLDIAAMMEAWLVDVGTVCRYIRYLAGQPDSPVELGPGGLKGLHGIGMTPLVASGDASSHAPHIYAQLGLHTNCLDHLKGMKSTLKARMATAADRIQHLEEELYDIMALQQQECLAAIGPPPSMAADHPYDSVQPQLKPAPTAAVSYGTAASLFTSSNLPLVPPTPMLQQLVQKGSTSRHNDESAAAPSRYSVPSLSCAGADEQSTSSSTPRLPAAVAVAANQSTSPASSVSSAAMPAAALLMSQEYADELMNPDFIDLDLVDSDDDIYQPASPVSSSQQTAGSGGFDPLRLSMLHVSFGGRAATEAAQANQQEQGAKAESAVDLAVPSSPDLDFLGTQQTAGLQLGQFLDSNDVDTPPHIGAERQPSAAVPPAEWPQKGVPAETIALVSTKMPIKAPGSRACMASVVGDVDDAHSVSPVTAEPTELLADPMVPLSGPGSDCFSTARPRRLTFAAAVSGDACGSVAVGRRVGNYQSPASSEVSSESPAEGHSTVAEQGLLQTQASLSLSLLRRRFAATQQQ